MHSLTLAASLLDSMCPVTKKTKVLEQRRLAERRRTARGGRRANDPTEARDRRADLITEYSNKHKPK